MKRVYFFLSALVLMTNAVFSQTGGGIFAPFVSRLKADVTGKDILLSWIDSDSVSGPVYVFRSTGPFQQNAAYINEGVAVPYGTRYYRDTVPYDGTWYYLVVASDHLQKKYDIVIPFNNTIDISVGGVPAGNTAEGDGYAPIFHSFSGTQLRPEPYQQIYPDNGSGSQAGAYAYSDSPAYPQASASATTSPYPQASASSATVPYPQASASSATAPYPQASAAYTSTPAYPSASAYALAPSAAHTVTGIRAVASGNGIEITFIDSTPTKNAVLYRNIQPLRGFSDLLTATVAALNVKSPHIDSPDPGTPYYYAVVYEDDIMNGRGELYPGGNATLMPVEISSQNTQGGEAYQTPYYPQTADTRPYGGDLASDVPPARNQSYTNPAGSYQGYPYGSGTSGTLTISEPRVFNRDMQSSADTMERRLGAIVQGPFAWRDWQTARSDLAAYLAGNPPSATASRARFYLAQCDYFLGDIRSALSEFLKLQQVYSDEVSMWIQACLDKIADR
jgi:hypothetical protein